VAPDNPESIPQRIENGKRRIAALVVVAAIVGAMVLWPIDSEEALLKEAGQQLDSLPLPPSAEELARTGTAKLNYVSAWRNYRVDAPSARVIEFYRELAQEKAWRAVCEPDGTDDWVLAYLDGNFLMSVRNDVRYKQLPAHTRFDVSMRWESGGPFSPCSRGGRAVEAPKSAGAPAAG
jgi:hypothetical protein